LIKGRFLNLPYNSLRLNMSLTTYLTDRYSVIYNALGWTGFDSIIEDTLELYGVDTEAEATNETKLHRLADYALWSQAKTDVTLDYDFSADGARYSRSQMFKMVDENLSEAFSNALPYLPDLQVDTTTVTIDNDPYDYNESRDNLGNL
jgi:hypothetical protein